MEISSCCGAPIVVEYHSDASNFSDDQYDLKVPVWVCSMCGAVIQRSGTGNSAVKENPGRR